MVKNLSITSTATGTTNIATPPSANQCCKHKKNTKLYVIFEHFSLDMQELLYRYMSHEVSWEEFMSTYKDSQKNVSENHDLEPYKDMLEHCSQNNQFIRLQGGFIP